MEIKTEIFTRVPPGDRWVETNLNKGKKEVIYNSLTDALEYYFQQHGIRQYFIDAEAGTISMIETVAVPEPTPKPMPTYSIYGDYV